MRHLIAFWKGGGHSGMEVTMMEGVEHQMAGATCCQLLLDWQWRPHRAQGPWESSTMHRTTNREQAKVLSLVLIT